MTTYRPHSVAAGILLIIATVAGLASTMLLAPILGTPGYLGRIATVPRRPPLVFAGDWLVQPCVEGAVRSGERAAAAFGRA